MTYHSELTSEGNVVQYVYVPKHLSLIVKTGGRYHRRPNPLADMYILIDRNQMKITHKHANRGVLARLSWIECTNAGITLSLTSSRPFMEEFTPAELRLIYENATGAQLKGYSNTLAQAVLAMARRLPESVAKYEEVDAQAKCIEDGDRSIYSYLPGSMVPQKHEGMFEPNSLTAARVEAEEAGAMQGATVPSYGHTAHANPMGNGAAAASTENGPTAAIKNVARTGGIREIVYRVADQMWEAAGSPMNKNKVLELRKTMMQELESNYGVKKTTSSTTLGDWMKLRIQ